MLLLTLLTVSLFAQATRPSPFGSYASHLEPAAMQGACRLQDQTYLRNLKYPFRAKIYPDHESIQLKNGKYDDDFGVGLGVEWSITLERQEPILLGQDRAVLLAFEALHNSSGEAQHILVVRCKGAGLEIVFEAGGEGVQSSQTGAGELQITHLVWTPEDSHASPSRKVDERYRWDVARGRFVLLRRTERKISR
jgi:hypothetical protein